MKYDAITYRKLRSKKEEDSNATSQAEPHAPPQSTRRQSRKQTWLRRLKRIHKTAEPPKQPAGAWDAGCTETARRILRRILKSKMKMKTSIPYPQNASPRTLPAPCQTWHTLRIRETIKKHDCIQKEGSAEREPAARRRNSWRGARRRAGMQCTSSKKFYADSATVPGRSTHAREVKERRAAGSVACASAERASTSIYKPHRNDWTGSLVFRLMTS